MTDPFLLLKRPKRAVAPAATGLNKQSVVAGNHGTRAHSKFSASGSERWFSCPGSVQLSEGIPSKSSKWSEEGTQAHEVLEAMMNVLLSGNDPAVLAENEDIFRKADAQMMRHATDATKFILGLHAKTRDSEVLVETRIYLDFIHPEMFGTFDGAVIDYFGTLHVFDYKYGAGVPVGPKENLQMIFYGIGLAARYHWNFKRVRLWIIQPRIRGYDGPMFWEVTTNELRRYVAIFSKAVERVGAEPNTYVEGSHCHWCAAKKICPKKVEAKLEQARSIFTTSPMMNKTPG